jgi:hypothetical protein
MPKQVLSLHTIKDIDFGLVAAAFDLEMQRVVKDLQDRPMDGKKRKVAIIFTIASLDERGDSIGVEAQVKSAIPDRVTRPYEMRTQQDGRIVFNPETPENPEQTTIHDELDRRQRERQQDADEIDREMKA